MLVVSIGIIIIFVLGTLFGIEIHKDSMKDKCEKCCKTTCQEIEPDPKIDPMILLGGYQPKKEE